MTMKTAGNELTRNLCLMRCLMSPDLAHLNLLRGWSAEEGILYCGDGAQRLGGLFDAFFESYWREFSSVRQVEWRGTLYGAARVTLLRRDAEGRHEHVLAQWRGYGGEEGALVVLSVSLAETGEGSLQIEIDDARGATFRDMGWCATVPPPRQVRLGLVITTYDREAFVRANLKKLAGQLSGHELLIVNHGVPGLGERLSDAAPPSMPVSFIDQENSGGAGGFTRGMVEHYRSGRVSHIILMDDDIDLPTDILPRIAAILAWSDRPFCVGGAMFDYNARSRLFSAGDYLQPDGFGIDHIAPEGGCDVAEATGVDFLARIHNPDFNGWWCFALPREALDIVGLPMPCFIRGDDVEYGYRLKRAGLPTVGWPGVAVWHLPFAAKSAAWHMFYDRRNSLFANSIHRRVGRSAAIRKLLGGFYHHLLRYDYDRVRAMTLGICAFNAGPAAMAAWTYREHDALLADTRRYGDTALAAIENVDSMAEPMRLHGLRRSLTMKGRLLADLFLPRRKTVALSLPADVVWRPDYVSRPSFVLEHSKDGAIRGAFRYDRRATWHALWLCACALTGMMRHFDQPAPLADVPKLR